MVDAGSSPSRRGVLAATGTVLTGAIAGCVGGIGTDGRNSGGTDRSGDAGGSGRCYAEAQSHLDDSLGSVENVGVLDGEVFVAIDGVAPDVTSYRVFRDGNALETFDAGERSRLVWPVPDAPFETSYRVVLRGDSNDSLGDFEFSTECSAG